MSSLGYVNARREQADRASADTLADKIRRNDALFGSDDFRDFLEDVAHRAGYFSANAVLPGFLAGYNAALRDIVNGLVVNSKDGAKWLSAYATKVASARTKEETAR